MIFAGLQKTTLSDYPGLVAAIVFTQGCNFRCPYCHNPELLRSRTRNPLSENSVFEFLDKRKSLVKGLVVTGGEPTLHDDLPDFLRKVKSFGYKIKLDTNGSRPSVLESLLMEKLVDYVAMDIKAPLEKYSSIACRPIDPDLILRSIRLLEGSDVTCEFRTTLVKPYLRSSDICRIASLLDGPQKYILQPFVSPNREKAHFQNSELAFPIFELHSLRSHISASEIDCSVR